MNKENIIDEVIRQAKDLSLQQKRDLLAMAKGINASKQEGAVNCEPH